MHPKTALKYVRYKLIELRRERDKSTILFGDFSISLSVIDRSSRQSVGI